MTYSMYCIRDAVLDAFEAPWCALSDASAQRTFVNLLKDDDSPYFRNKEDFSLWRVGQFDTENGIVSCEPVRLMTGFGGDK